LGGGPRFGSLFLVPWALQQLRLFFSERRRVKRIVFPSYFAIVFCLGYAMPVLGNLVPDFTPTRILVSPSRDPGAGHTPELVRRYSARSSVDRAFLS